MRTPTLITSLFLHGAMLGGLSLVILPGKRLVPPEAAHAVFLPSEPSPPPASETPVVEVEAMPEPEMRLLEPEEAIDHPIDQQDLSGLLPSPLAQDQTPVVDLEREVVLPDLIDRAAFLARLQPPDPVSDPIPTEPAPETPVSMPFVPAEALESENAPPEYPARAIRMGLEGTVLLELEITAGGDVADLRIHRSSGHALLDRAAAKALLRWRFRPALDEGVTVPSSLQLPVVFRLDGSR